MNRYLIEIAWSEEDQGFIATVPDLPGCSAWGRTATDAVREVEDAQAAWIDACAASGEPVPAPATQARRAA
jgi:predicted RNase H-like HicB family nuclease